MSPGRAAVGWRFEGCGHKAFCVYILPYFCVFPTDIKVLTLALPSPVAVMEPSQAFEKGTPCTSVHLEV